MKIPHFTLAALLLAALPCVTPLFAAEEAAAEETEAATSPLETLQAEPNSRQALNAYLQSTVPAAMKEGSKDPKAGIAKLEEVKANLTKLEPTEPGSTTTIKQYSSQLDSLIEQLELQQISIKDMQAKLDADKENADLIGKYGRKAMLDLSTLVSEDWQKGEKALDEQLAYLKSLSESVETDDAKAAIEGAEKMLTRLTPKIERERKLAELIGKPAMPLSAQAWVNGAPLTDEELKGKVVLLDFFAIWCGPCIASFPHLHELNEEFGDKGLTIIGVTSYYNYGWNEEKGSPEPSRDGKVSPEDEQAMLEKFMAKYDLEHVVAVDPEGAMSKYYAVMGIPHMVLINQEGKVALVKVGFGNANSKAITEKIKELLGEG
ncbi:TlpA family protein disulfide reductase [Blastopirellula retiformator]|uniref:Thiol-disulfide oxidoreductase ResA n=1 Tax=Blastopirellula retiformator TaxID=2527970 RepID=A0A5C5V885_9BACT|nr:TlpA disulfide reductase family protein [Blastopirellula retiformator]TWT34776.1 Thiol-disulfide oxidoreductase ResA [Blastopirellula retiformator]